MGVEMSGALAHPKTQSGALAHPKTHITQQHKNILHVGHSHNRAAWHGVDMGGAKLPHYNAVLDVKQIIRHPLSSITHKL